MIKYDKLWKTMRDRGITQYMLINQHGISTGQLDRLRKNQNVSTHTIDVLCDIIGCEVEDVMKHQKLKNDLER